MIELNSFFQIKPFYDYLRKQRENRKFLKSLEIVATFLLTSFFLFFAIKPTVSTISSLVGEIKAKEILKQQMHNKINNIIQAQNSFLQIQNKYQLIESCLPSRPKYNQADTQIRRASVKSGTNIQTVNYNVSEKEIEKKSTMVSYNLSFLTQSSYSQSIALLEKLQNLRRLINIESISYSKPATGSGINTNTTASVFYLKN